MKNFELYFFLSTFVSRIKIFSFRTKTYSDIRLRSECYLETPEECRQKEEDELTVPYQDFVTHDLRL